MSDRTEGSMRPGTQAPRDQQARASESTMGLTTDFDASLPVTLIAGNRVIRGTVTEVFRSGDVGVLPHGSDKGVLCDVLLTGDSPTLTLSAGNDVLLLMPADPEIVRPCVLGRVGPYAAPDRERVTIEATRELKLSCGDAQVTLRHDGKVLTRAKDIASIAKRRQRIKGGSVEIN